MATKKTTPAPKLPELEELQVSEIAAIHTLLADLSLPLTHPHFEALTHARPALLKLDRFLQAFNEQQAETAAE